MGVTGVCPVPLVEPRENILTPPGDPSTQRLFNQYLILSGKGPQNKKNDAEYNYPADYGRNNPPDSARLQEV
jgi:hypothetical protein